MVVQIHTYIYTYLIHRRSANILRGRKFRHSADGPQIVACDKHTYIDAPHSLHLVAPKPNRHSWLAPRISQDRVRWKEKKKKKQVVRPDRNSSSFLFDICVEAETICSFVCLCSVLWMPDLCFLPGRETARMEKCSPLFFTGINKGPLLDFWTETGQRLIETQNATDSSYPSHFIQAWVLCTYFSAHEPEEADSRVPFCFHEVRRPHDFS